MSLIVKRWWEQYCKLPWPDTLALYLRGLVPGPEDGPRLVRRTVIRYCLLSYVLCVRRMSARLRKRFPSMQEVMRTGLVRPDEAAKIGEEDHNEMYASNWWMPLQWCTELLSDANKKGQVVSAPGYSGLMAQVAAFRTALTEVSTYGHIPVPLVYTQVVTLAVYIYFGVALIGEQWIIICTRDTCTPDHYEYQQSQGKDINKVDLWYPIFMTVKFLFYFGWLRVAETLYNPFGEDDDDFELNELINRHFRVGLSIVDQVDPPPELQKDIFWDRENPELDDFPPWDEMYVANMYSNDNVNPTSNEDQYPEDHYVSPAERRDPMA